MKRKALGTVLIVGLAAAAAGSGACGGSNRGPIAPTVPSNGSAFTISGTITEYHGGPVFGAVVTAYSCDSCTAYTDNGGHYSIAMPSAGPASLAVRITGYQSVWKYNLSAEYPTADFVLHRSLTANSLGGTLADIIEGDEFLGLSDDPFGELCTQMPCRLIGFDEFPGTREVEITVRWPDATRHLALYKYTGVGDHTVDGDPTSTVPLRFSGPSGFVARVSVSGDFDAIAIGFEQAGGGPAARSDSEPFDLTLRPVR